MDLSQRKFGDYCKTFGLTDPDEITGILTDLLPYAKIIHFQVGNEDEFKAVQNLDFDSELGQLTRTVKESQTEAPFVIEINFPLMLKVFKGNTFKFYSQIVDFIRRS